MKPNRLFTTILEGKPDDSIEVLPEPDELIIPLRTTRFQFNDIAVKEGQDIEMGTVLARDEDNFSLPLLAPRGGIVRLEKVAGHIVLEKIKSKPEKCSAGPYAEAHIQKDDKTAKIRLRRLVEMGAWSYLYSAHDYSLPSPDVTPQAVIVSTMRLEPYMARGSVQIKQEFETFVRGLEHLQSLVEYQPIYLVMAPSDVSEESARIQNAVRGYASVKVITQPPIYPNDNFTLLARQLKLKSTAEQPVWCLNASGVLTIEKILSQGTHDTRRTIAIAGPGVEKPTQVKALIGYPIQAILKGRVKVEPSRVVYNGVYTGRMLGDDLQGVDLECGGLTVLEEQTQREFLSFINPGFDKQSFSKSFASLIRGSFREKKTTAIGGERRPCVNCQFCEDVCPVGIMPYLIHKYLYQDMLEEAEKARLDLCILCGLCSYACPSKIELRQQFIEAKERIKEELHSVTVEE